MPRKSKLTEQINKIAGKKQEEETDEVTVDEVAEPTEEATVEQEVAMFHNEGIFRHQLLFQIKSIADTLNVVVERLINDAEKQ